MPDARNAEYTDVRGYGVSYIQRPSARAVQTGQTGYDPPGPISHLCSVKFQTCSLFRYLQSLQARAECLYLSHNVACRQLLQTGRHDEFTKDDTKIAVNNRLDLMLSECTTSQRIMWYSLFSHSRCTS